MEKSSSLVWSMLQESELGKPVQMHFKLLEVISMKRIFLNFIISFFMMLSFQNLYADNHEMMAEEPIVEAVVEKLSQHLILVIQLG